MKPPILLCSLALCIMPFGGCADGYDTNLAMGWNAYPYDAWYDNYYGPIYDGYWGQDDFFYFRVLPSERTFRRGDRNHFHRGGENPPDHRFQRFTGTLRPPPHGTRMPKFPPAGQRLRLKRD